MTIEIERILGTDTRKTALEKTDRNAVLFRDEANKSISETVDLTSLFVNSWVAAYADNACYASKVGNIIAINLRIKDGTNTPGTVIFTLPINLRPLKAVNINVFNNNTMTLIGNVQIGVDGKCVIAIPFLSTSDCSINTMIIGN